MLARQLLGVLLVAVAVGGNDGGKGTAPPDARVPTGVMAVPPSEAKPEPPGQWLLYCCDAEGHRRCVLLNLAPIGQRLASARARGADGAWSASDRPRASPLPRRLHVLQPIHPPDPREPASPTPPPPASSRSPRTPPTPPTRSPPRAPRTRTPPARSTRRRTSGSPRSPARASRAASRPGSGSNRTTTLTMSAAPRTASMATLRGYDRETPKTTVAAPKTATPASILTPARPPSGRRAR